MATPFQEKVYETLRRVPRGKVTTYLLLGKAIHCNSARAIGQAMRCNPYAPQVPCHRVVASDGSIGGFMGKTSGKEITRKIGLLKKEGVHVKNGAVSDFREKRYTF